MNDIFKSVKRQFLAKRILKYLWSILNIFLAGSIFMHGKVVLAQSSPVTKITNKRFDPKALIGLKSSSQNELYPDGWKVNLATGYGHKGPGLSGLINKDTKQYAFVLIKTTDEGFIEKTRTWTVMDAIEIKASASNDFRIARRCYYGEKPKKLSEAIVAEVRFKNRCGMTTTNIQRAWRINMKDFKFEPITEIRGLTCEYAHVSIGEPDDRKGCPTYNYVE